MATSHPSGPALRSVPITKADSDFDACVSLHVGTGGDVVGRLVGDTVDRTFKNVPSGATLPYSFKRVATATTAADIVGLYR